MWSVASFFSRHRAWAACFRAVPRPVSGALRSIFRTAVVGGFALVVFTALGTSLGPVPARAEKPVLHLAYSPDGWPPYIITDDDVAKDHGIVLDLVRQAAREAGAKIECAHYPDLRGVAMVREGAFDAWPKAQEWVENPEDFTWSAPLLLSEDVLVCRADRPITFRTISDLFGLRLGTVLGYGYPSLEDAFHSGRIERADSRSAETQIEMLRRGRVDALVMERRIADWMLRRTPGVDRADYRLSKRSIHCVQYRLMFTTQRDWTDFVQRFDAAVARMRGSGELKAIFDRYH